ncbi:MAG: GFA family protein [Pseudomonadota bacterium]
MNDKPISLTSAAAGGCLCGAVRFDVSAGVIPESGYCHCRTCQLQSGAPVVAWFAVAPTRFKYVKGAPKNYRASPLAAREFCGDCGTYLVFREDDASATISINTATLDEPALVPPSFHIYCESKIAWFDTADSSPRYARGKP